ncbi:MAG TPA: carboxypeptidase-like regulatory domain-containing protein, partial [Bacteroidota bacterium]|nr:carboxypeptidase-like regulatory domain-containing protein [Bacteroidota bacterium]
MGSVSGWMFAASTGKISGKITDASTHEPLIGVSVTVEGTRTGGASDPDGNYFVLNVPPGTYTLHASAVGYRPSTVTNVKVQVDLTTNVDFALTSATVELKDEVVIVAQRPIVQRDLTSSSNKVSADQIKSFPVEDVSGLVNLQAGVVDGHFRGGRSGEVLYLIDGIPVTDAYSGNAGVTAENQSIQELEVISGTFNAEYGEAMSGIVNQVTKEGGEKFSGELSFYTGDYISNHKDLFPHIDKISPQDIYNIQGSLSGPIVPDVSFFISGRKYYNDGYLYGIRKFMPTDSSNFSSNNPSQWYIGATGDNKYVPMNPEDRITLQGKISVRLFQGDKLRLQALVQNRDFRNYDYRYKYDPNGNYYNFTRGLLASASYTRVFSASTFLEVHTAWFNNKEQSYVYEDPY